MAQADPDIASDAQTSPAPKAERKLGRFTLMFSLPLILVAIGAFYWISLQGQISTDNAYVKQDKLSISAEVGGKIIEVAAAENGLVVAGDLLFRIDPEPFQIELTQADAQIATAQAEVTALANDSALSGADIAAAREDIAFAQNTQARQKALWERGFTTKADYEAAQHLVAQARELLHLAQARSSEASAKLATGAAVPGQNPRIAAARARRAAAQLDLSRTEVRAPMAGKIGEAERLKLGQQVIANLPVLTLVASQGTYIEANFKETELNNIKVGQIAEVTFDAYPDLVIKAHVASIGAGTNSEFSVLPAQNTSANWVKVTQRVPVRIALDDKSPRDLIAGLSAEVTVYIDGRKR